MSPYGRLDIGTRPYAVRYELSDFTRSQNNDGQNPVPQVANLSFILPNVR